MRISYLSFFSCPTSRAKKAGRCGGQLAVQPSEIPTRLADDDEDETNDDEDDDENEDGAKTTLSATSGVGFIDETIRDQSSTFDFLTF